MVEKIDIPKTAGELRQIARETFGKYYGDKVQSELVHNFAKYGLACIKARTIMPRFTGRTKKGRWEVKRRMRRTEAGSHLV